MVHLVRRKKKTVTVIKQNQSETLEPVVIIGVAFNILHLFQCPLERFKIEK